MGWGLLYIKKDLYKVLCYCLTQDVIYCQSGTKVGVQHNMRCSRSKICAAAPPCVGVSCIVLQAQTCITEALGVYVQSVIVLQSMTLTQH